MNVSLVSILSSYKIVAAGMAALILLAICVVFVPTVFAGGNDTCYGSLGCFPNKSPWSDMLRPVPPPLPPSEIDTRFYLYTRSSPNRYYVQHPADGVWSVDGSNFDGSKTTFFIVHGFTQIGNETIMQGIKDALLVKTDGNVIIVDWGKGAAGVINFLQVVGNTRVVGALIIQLLRYLIAERGADASRVHFVGFSLGAHIAGYVGKAIPNIARITALEAGQPLFEGYDASIRLNLTDAKYIDAIHTDGRALVPFIGFGYIGPVGHVDFFVNGGWNQPGCAERLIPNITSVSDLFLAPAWAIYYYFRCPHDRAAEVFISSLAVKNCTFWGHKLSPFHRSVSALTGGVSPNIWGEPCDKTTCSALGFDSIHYPARGSFDVVTSNTGPSYCRPEPKADSSMIGAYIP